MESLNNVNMYMLSDHENGPVSSQQQLVLHTGFQSLEHSPSQLLSHNNASQMLLCCFCQVIMDLCTSIAGAFAVEHSRLRDEKRQFWAVQPQ